MKCAIKKIASQPCFVVASDQVELAVTCTGGHLAPVKFYRRDKKPVQPYYISPWQNEGLRIDEPVLVGLRGDFFCMPFGANETPLGRERHRAHGQPAYARWQQAGLARKGKAATLTLAMNTTVRPGRVVKQITLVDGQNVVYTRHILQGYSGPMPLAHHATLAMPQRERSVLIATSRYNFGMTFPVPPGNPSIGEYDSILPGAKFAELSRVPMNRMDKPLDDFSAFPARKGFCDLIAVFHKYIGMPTWTAATFVDDGFLWFSLKDPRVLPTLMFWVENHGRHTPPWNGRNCCLGLEDICGFFSVGLAESVRPNILTRMGIPTAVKLSPKKPTVINYIQGVVKVPKKFGRVRTAHFQPGEVVFFSDSGKIAAAPVNHEFLRQK
ncbi:MAG: hypothetical protein HZA50_06375 [Planctomycetes bacterium]|nr:hypothetical protein [Planctomycetota bacterium]